MREAYETIEREGFTAGIFADECAENPFENWDGQRNFYHFNQWANGDVWGFKIEDEQGNEIDSCWGFYGIESAREEVNSQLDYAIKERAENLKETRQLVFG